MASSILVPRQAERRIFPRMLKVKLRGIIARYAETNSVVSALLGPRFFGTGAYGCGFLSSAVRTKPGEQRRESPGSGCGGCKGGGELRDLSGDTGG